MTDQLAGFSPLARSIFARENYRIVTADSLDEVAGALPLSMLFAVGDHNRLTECDDAAVILAELDKAQARRVVPLVCARADEREIQKRYRFTGFPSLIFLSHGRYLGCIERVLDWSDYRVQIPQILSREPHDPPAFRMPEHCAPAPRD